MGDMGAPGEVAEVGGGPVNWGDNVAGMGQSSEPPAIDENALTRATSAPTEPEPAAAPDTAQTAPTFWEPGQPLPWAGSPDAPALPDLPEYPPMDPQQLLPAVLQAREQAIVAHFQALIAQANDAGQQHEINREYQITLREYRAAVREQQAELRDWQRQHRERQMMVNMVPALRDQHAEALSKKHNVPKEAILYDHFTKQPIWNHQAMERQAQFLGQMGYKERVQQRGDRDAGVVSTGAAGPAPGDVSRMSDAQFAAYREQVRKSGGRMLNRVG